MEQTKNQRLQKILKEFDANPDEFIFERVFNDKLINFMAAALEMPSELRSQIVIHTNTVAERNELMFNILLSKWVCDYKNIDPEQFFHNVDPKSTTLIDVTLEYLKMDMDTMLDTMFADLVKRTFWGEGLSKML